ncbi:MAG TPA: ABC transporter permease [Gemmatimonadaceae bacterium]|nr:ABC transporter permease [Gemmatimonadaceae bacterium]
MTALLHDVRHALRTLRKSPGFTCVAVVTLALGIGINTMMFSSASSLLLSRLPYSDPERLVALYETRPAQHVTDGSLSYAELRDWQRQTRTFSEVAAFTHRDFNLSHDEEPVGVSGAVVSVNVFHLLGVHAALGRTFTSDEGESGRDGVVLLGYSLWQQRFASDSSIVGRTIVVNGAPRTVIGVMPPRFQFPEWQEMWVPLAPRPSAASHDAHTLHVLARLAPGVTVARARANVAALAPRLAARSSDADHGASARVASYRDELAPKDVRLVIALMQAAVGFVLLIACANVANLLLARATAREKEIAIRTALGASRWRIVRQLLLESVILALVAGGFGILIASWGIHWVWARIPVRMPFYITWSIDRSALAFTFIVALATGVLFGILPALHASRADVQTMLKAGARGSSAGTEHMRTRGALVAGQMALSMMLIIGATLLIRSFIATTAVDVGFDPARILTLQLHFTGERYAGIGRRTALVHQVTRRIEAIPGVQSAAATSYVPLFGVTTMSRFHIEGRAVAPNERPSALYRPVTAAYFGALHVPIVRGRAFTDRETSDAAHDVVLVSETLAERYYPDENPLGRRLRVAADSTGAWLTIVGVVADIKQRWIGERPEPQIYLPYAHSAPATTTIMVRTAGDPALAASAVRAAVRDVDPTIALFDVQPVRAILDLSFWKSRLYGAMFGAYAAIALVLAAVGVYGMMAYAASQRVHEIGVRVALGAQSRDVLRLVVGQGFAATMVGVVAGLGGAFAVTRLLAGLLFGVTSTDPMTFIGVPVLLTAVALLASYLPARRAARVDPVIALRSE